MPKQMARKKQYIWVVRDGVISRIDRNSRGSRIFDFAILILFCILVSLSFTEPTVSAIQMFGGR